MDFNLQQNGYLNYFEESLIEFFNKYDNGSIPDELIESVKYSVFNGGKRIRPIIMYATAEMLGLKLSEVKFFALANEFIHSYSLVHDDLPCMDNDDYRRGKLSTHKKFGENMGVLAGDSLLNLSVETCLYKERLTQKDALAMKLLYDCSGAKGMIKGQVLDLLSEKSTEISEELLSDIFINKTSKLIMASLLIPSVLSDNLFYNELTAFGINLGVLFQITDDLLDVNGTLESIGKTPHKDEKQDKLSSVKLYGEKLATEKAEILYENCISILNKIPNSQFLANLTEKIYKRKS